VSEFGLAGGTDKEYEEDDKAVGRESFRHEGGEKDEKISSQRPVVESDPPSLKDKSATY